jgi:hypothetical protein
MPDRTAAFARTDDLESALAELSAMIGPGADAWATQHREGPRRPLLLLTSTPRAGSTAFLQWLVSSGALATPTNLISRFYRGPAVGALVQRLLFDPTLQFRDELALGTDTAEDTEHQSTLGKTSGPRSPNEFWYFWRHFLGLGNPPVLTEAARRTADTGGFCAHLGALETVLGRPLALKAMIASWELGWVADLLPQAVFVDLQRDPLEVMASLLRARVLHGGDRQRWYAFAVPGLPRPSGLGPELEVAVQVRAMRCAIESSLATLPGERVVRVEHRAWRADPAAVQRRLAVHWPCLAETSLRPPRPPGPPVDRSELAAAWAASAELVDERGWAHLC